MSYFPSAGGGGGWTTAYAVDFSSLATGSHPGGDGTVTIDGKTWYAQNVANSDEMRTVNGEGLVIDPNGTSSTLFNGTRDCPNFSLKLTDAAAGLYLGGVTDIRVSVLWGATGISENFETILFGLERFQAMEQGYWLAKNWNGSLKYVIRRQYTSGTTDLDVTSLLGGTEDVFQFRMSDTVDCSMSCGVSSGGDFPANSALIPVGRAEAVGTSVGQGTKIPVLSDLAIVFACYPVNTSNALRGVLKRLKVESRL